MSSKRSRVHPKYKTRYRVDNWSEYDRSLVSRGDLTIWISPVAIASWNAKPTGSRGAQRKYSDLAIETTLTLRLLFRLPLRQAEGFVRSIFALLDFDADVPDHTRLSRRSRTLRVALSRPIVDGPIDLIIDSSGLAIFGEGEWAAAKHGGKGVQGWRKLHLGVDGDGVIIAQKITDSNVDDASAGIEMMAVIGDSVTAVIGDTAYDTIALYNAATARGSTVVVPPIKNAAVDRSGSPERKRTVQRIRDVGRREWKRESGYRRQARAENAFFRYKSIIGDRLRARHRDAQQTEATLACNVLNRMTALGRPASVAIAS